MKIKNTIKSALLGIALTVGGVEGKAETIEVWTQRYDNYSALQDAWDSLPNTEPNTIILRNGGNSAQLLSSLECTGDKQVTIVTPDGVRIGDGPINIYGTSELNLIGITTGSAVNMFDASKFGSYNGDWVNQSAFINDYSTGKLTLSQNMFEQADSAVNIYSTGSYSITENVFRWQNVSINANPNQFRTNLSLSQSQQTSGLENVIANNTLDTIGDTAIRLGSPALVLNNSFSEMPNAVSSTTDYTFEGNNLWNIGNSLQSKSSLSKSSSGVNYSFEPNYNGSDWGDYSLSSDSALRYRGVFVDGVTTWFPNEQTTWIGGVGTGIETIPEIKTSQAVSLGIIGLGILYALRNKRHKPRLNNYLSGKGKESNGK